MNPKELQHIPVITFIDEAKHLNERQWEMLREAFGDANNIHTSKLDSKEAPQ